MHLPESMRAKLDLVLFSELEGRVPKGAYQKFFMERLQEFFATKSLDLSPFLGTLPGAAVVRGREEVLANLSRSLESRT